MTVLFFQNSLGVILSFLYPFIFVRGKVNDITRKQQILLYLSSQAIVCGVLFLVILLFFFERAGKLKAISKRTTRMKQAKLKAGEDPLQPAPYNTKYFDIKGNLLFAVQIRYLLKDGAYIMMFVVAGTLVSLLSAVGTTLNSIVSIWGYPQVSSLFYLFLPFIMSSMCFWSLF